MQKSKKLKLLIVSRSLPPSRGGSAFVIGNLASNFSNDDLVVLGGSSKLITPAKNIDDIEYNYQFTQLSIMGRGERYLKLFRWLLFPFLIQKIKSICEEEDISDIIGVYPDIFFTYAAYFAAKKLNLNYYSYFHNTYLENRKGIHLWFAKKVQPKIFKASKKIYVMSDGMLDFYSKKYPLYNNKFFPLVHTFKEYPPTKSYSFQNKNIYQLALFGNFNDSNIDATKSLIQASQLLKNVKINIYTHVPKVLLKIRGIDIDQICYKGFVPDDQFYPEIQKNDIGVVTHGFLGGYSEIEYQTIFPTRMIPQLLSGNPVIVIAPEESFLASFVKKHDCGLLITQRDPEHIAQKIQDLLNDATLKKRYVNNAQSTVKLFFGPNVVHSLKTHILQDKLT